MGTVFLFVRVKSQNWIYKGLVHSFFDTAIPKPIHF